MSIIAKFYNGMSVSDTPSGSSTTAMPSTLHIVSGQYVYNGAAYDCRLPGLYRFFDPSTQVCDQKLCQCIPEPDVYPYIAALSWVHADGLGDGTIGINNQLAVLHNHIAEMRCGDIAALAVTLINQYAEPLYPAREVQVLTAEGATGLDDGHVIFEVKIDGAWRLFDLTNGRYYTDAAGNHLSLKGIIETGMPNCSHVLLSDKIVVPTRESGRDNYFYYDFLEPTDAGTIAWCNRIFQIPIVGTTAYMPPGTESQQSWVQGLGFTVVSQADWDAQFYS